MTDDEGVYGDFIDALFPGGLSVDEALRVLGPVAVYALAMAIYAVFIFRFYRFIAGRDMFNLDFSKHDNSSIPVLRDLLHLVGYVAKYVILFPAFAFFWFAVLTLMLSFLSEGREMSDILLIVLATVSTIRVCAYYDEDLSRDLAKILPFAVLAIFLIDTTFFDVEASLEVLRQTRSLAETIFYYLAFLIALEFGLRFAYGLFRAVFPVKKAESTPPATGAAEGTPATTSDD
jgi:hypothetical protein